MLYMVNHYLVSEFNFLSSWVERSVLEQKETFSRHMALQRLQRLWLTEREITVQLNHLQLDMPSVKEESLAM